MPILFFGGATSGVTSTVTVRDLLTGALQDLNMADGSTVDPNDLDLAFRRFNDFLDDLRNEGLLSYTVTRTTWTLTAGKSSYTVGITGDIVIDRPVSANDIGNIGYIDSSSGRALEILRGPVLTDDQYAAIPMKTLSATYPTAFYYDADYPVGTLSVYPVPSSSGLQGVIYTPNLVSEYSTLNDLVALPPGFRRFYRNAVTVEIAAAFEKQPPPQVVEALKESRAKIKRKNERLQTLSFDPALTSFGRPTNIYTGE